MNRRLLAVVVLAAAVLTLGGCYPKDIQYLQNPWLIFAKFVGYEASKAKTSATFEDTVDVDVQASVGGIANPSYTVNLHDPDGGSFGTFSGTAVIKRGRFVTLKAVDTDELKQAVAALLSKALGGESVTITSAKATVHASQTPGGVDAVFSVKVKYSGTVDSGPYVGATIKGGKISASGNNPTPLP